MLSRGRRRQLVGKSAAREPAVMSLSSSSAALGEVKVEMEVYCFSISVSLTPVSYLIQRQRAKFLHHRGNQFTLNFTLLSLRFIQRLPLPSPILFNYTQYGVWRVGC